MVMKITGEIIRKQSVLRGTSIKYVYLHLHSIIIDLIACVYEQYVQDVSNKQFKLKFRL